MRLIDADALVEEIEKEMENGFPANENLSLYAISCIAHAPTVDVLGKIRDEIEDYVCNHETNTDKAQGMLNALQIIDKYR